MSTFKSFSFPSGTIAGHIAALFTAFVWGCTFISSKILLQIYTPIEVLFLRFILGFIILLIIHPRIPKPLSVKSEVLFALGGLFGVMMYYFLENMALTYTLAANVSVITCTAPFFTALFARIFLKEKTFTPRFFFGFLAAITGIALISFSGQELQLDLTGMVLAILASASWGVYSVIVRKNSSLGFSSLEMTQRFFFYGLLFMVPVMFAMHFQPPIRALAQPKYLLNLLFLGSIACAACFVTWNFALTRLGTMGASVYIYLPPVITVVASMIILKEHISPWGFLGMFLTLAGLIISEMKGKKKY